MSGSPSRHVRQGPNSFRLVVPAVVSNFADFSQQKQGESLTGNWVHSSTVAGVRAAGLSFAVRTVSSPGKGAEFQLVFPEGIVQGIAEYRLIITSPSGTVLSLRPAPKGCGLSDLYKTRRRRRSSINCFGFVSVDEARRNGWLFDGNLHVAADIFVELINDEIENRRQPDDARTTVNGEVVARVADGPVAQDADREEILHLRDEIEHLNEILHNAEEGNSRVLPILKQAELSLKLHLLVKDKGLTPPLPPHQYAKMLGIRMEMVVPILTLAHQIAASIWKLEGFLILENNHELAVKKNLLNQLKEASPSLYEEYLDHHYLRFHGVPRKKSSEEWDDMISEDGAPTKRQRTC